MQSKHILLDLQRRIEDFEQGMNPQYIDSMIDFCAPRIFDAVNFRKYLGQQELTTKYLINYFSRLQVYQNFIPESNILMPFRLNCSAVNKILQNLCDQMTVDREWRDMSISQFRKAIGLIYNSDQQQYQSDMSVQLLNSLSVMPEDLRKQYARLLQIYPQANLSLLLDQDMFNQVLEE